MIVYHGTCQENSNVLMKNGWQPNSGMVGGNMGQKRYLYVTTHPENARWFANEKGCDSILAIQVEMFELGIDPEDGTYDTVEEEIESANASGIPASLTIRRPIDASRFSQYGKGSMAEKITIKRSELEKMIREQVAPNPYVYSQNIGKVTALKEKRAKFIEFAADQIDEAIHRALDRTFVNDTEATFAGAYAFMRTEFYDVLGRVFDAAIAKSSTGSVNMTEGLDLNEQAIGKYPESIAIQAFISAKNAAIDSLYGEIVSNIKGIDLGIAQREAVEIANRAFGRVYGEFFDTIVKSLYAQSSIHEQVEPSVSESLDDIAMQYGFEPSGNGHTYMQIGYDGGSNGQVHCEILVRNSVHSKAPYGSVEGISSMELKVASGLYNQSAFVRSYSSPRPQQVHKMFADAAEMNRLLNAG